MFRIGVDIDGVIIDFDRHWVNKHNSSRRPKLDYEMPQKWNELHTLAGFDSPSDFWHWYKRDGGFLGAPLYPGAVKALHELCTHYDVFLVTNRPRWYSARAAVYNLLETFALVQNISGVVFLDRKTDLPVDFWVEDNPYNLHQMQATNGADRVFRVVRPWNDPSHYPSLNLGYCRTAHSLQHVVELLEVDREKAILA